MSILRVGILVLALGLVCAAEGATPSDIPSGAGNRKATIAEQLAAVGDLLSAKGNAQQAVGAYLKALALGRADFPAARRLEITNRLVKLNRLEVAIDEIGRLLAAEPQNLAARIHLARHLSLAGQHKSALSEAEKVLAQAPDNQEAQRIKADVARWRGDYATALPLLYHLNAQKKDFETTLALAGALLESGNIAAARATRDGLRATDPQQDIQLAEFNQALKRSVAPSITLGSGYYQDTSKNTRTEYKLLGEWIADWSRTGFYLHEFRAWNTAEEHAATRLGITFGLPLHPMFDIEGAIGTAGWHNAGWDGIATFRAATRVKSSDWQVNAHFQRDILTDTAQILDHKIRFDEVDLRLRYEVTDRLYVKGKQVLRAYSDDNASWDAEITPTYILLQRPHIALGYRHEQLGFQRQSGSGYFDPDHLISNQVILALVHGSEKFSGNIELFAGRQSVERYGVSRNDTVAGFYGSANYNVTRRMKLSLESEGGNYALLTAGGFRYYMVRAKLTASF